LVASESPAELGTTWTMPVSASWFGVASGTSATPGSFLISAFRSSIMPSGSSEVTMSAVTISGALWPGP
jgi:hypothetical protein